MVSKNDKGSHIPSNLYNKITKNMPIVSVEAIIVMDSALLFMKRNNQPAEGQWWFPGGRMYKGESFEQTLFREVKEETSLQISSYKFINIYSRVFPERHDVTIAYLCTCEGKISINNEHSEYKLFKEPPINLHPYLLNLIKDAHCEKFLKKG
jgi:ADP-ribose pyrophosphatase YjhB (NUDIX family)